MQKLIFLAGIVAGRQGCKIVAMFLTLPALGGERTQFTRQDKSYSTKLLTATVAAVVISCSQHLVTRKKFYSYSDFSKQSTCLIWGQGRGGYMKENIVLNSDSLDKSNFFSFKYEMIF